MKTKDRLDKLGESVHQIKNHLGINLLPLTDQCAVIKGATKGQKKEEPKTGG